MSTLVGAVVALAGSFAASKLAADQGRRDWLRSKRADSYERFYGLLQEIQMDAIMQEILHTSYGPGERTPIQRASAEQLRDRATLLVDTSHLVQLYASPKRALSARFGGGPLCDARRRHRAEPFRRGARKSYREFQKALVEAEADLRHDLEVGKCGGSPVVNGARATGSCLLRMTGQGRSLRPIGQSRRTSFDSHGWTPSVSGRPTRSGLSP